MGKFFSSVSLYERGWGGDEFDMPFFSKEYRIEPNNTDWNDTLDAGKYAIGMVFRMKK